MLGSPRLCLTYSEGNRLANQLADYGHDLSSLVYFDVPPPFVTQTLFDDCIGTLLSWHLRGVSSTLVAVMGSRFKKTGKAFLAGVVSSLSLVMAGGYLHGLMRSAH